VAHSSALAATATALAALRRAAPGVGAGLLAVVELQACRLLLEAVQSALLAGHNELGVARVQVRSCFAVDKPF
jgi:hypothetical protein